MIAWCTVYNLRGARSVGTASVLLALILLGPFAVLSALGALPTSSPAPPETLTAGALGPGILVAMWNFMGWDNASTFAEEVEDPQRTYPRAMMLGLCTVALTYLLPVLAAWHSGIPASSWSSGAWVNVAQRIGGPALGHAVVLGGLICGVGMYNALLLSYSRLPAVMAKDGLLPARFARTNEHGVPVLSVIACSALYAVALVFDFRKLIEIDLLFYGGALLLEFAALVVLRIREPRLARPFRVPGGMLVASILGLGPLLLFGAGLFKEFSDGASHRDSLFVAAFAVALGAVVWRTRSLVRSAP
jgi:amino acid transporter